MYNIKGGYYIKARCIQNSKVSEYPPHVREIWDWILKEANHKEKKSGGIIIKRGQLIRSYSDIIEGLKWKVGWRTERYSKSNCETSMKMLKKAEMITTKKTTRGMLITVLNYDKYQDPKNYENYKENHKKTTRKPQTNDTINKNEKNDKNIQFEKFWNLYGKKIDKHKCELKWDKIKNEERELIIENIPRYIMAHQDIKYRKNPLTYLNGKCWEDEIETKIINEYNC